MKTMINVSIRLTLGIALIAFGLDKFLEFIPHGHHMTESLVSAYNGLLANKFILPTVGVIEAAVGVSLLFNKFTNIALLALFPISYGMVAFHLAVDIPGILPALIVALANVYLLFDKREKLAVLLINN